MRTIAIVQARMGSTRLPGKVLLDLGGVPVLDWVTGRLQGAKTLDGIAIATSVDPTDDPIEAFGKARGITVVRGPLDDVLERYAMAAVEMRADAVVRITADCPLIDPGVVDAIVGVFKREGYEYASNTRVRSFPRGLDAEVFTRASLDRAARLALETFEREHVTPYIYAHAEPSRIGSLVDPSYDRSAWRWTLDTAQDYAFLQALVAALTPAYGPDMTTAEAISVLEAHPELLSINADVVQRATERE